MKNYLPFILFILGWWLVAFFPQGGESLPLSASHIQEQSCFPSPIDCLSSMKRESLRQALTGDISLMTKLMTEWDLDAQILQAHGCEAKRLPPEIYIHAQTLGRHLKQHTPESPFTKPVQDDTGKWFTPVSEGFVPQTYLAATFLLSLTDPDKIAALPRGIREQTNLFPQSVTEKIPADLDRYLDETLFLQKPKLAFVSHFSHPAMLQALSKQGMALFTIDSVFQVESIPENILRIGQVAGSPIKAELLNCFLAAAFLAIENRTHAIKDLSNTKVMTVNYYSCFSAPTETSLTGQLLKRLKVNSYKPSCSTCYAKNIGKEDILSFDPDILLISTPGAHEICGKQELSQIKKIALVDDTVQQSPTHLIALAYYDLAKACLE